MNDRRGEAFHAILEAKYARTINQISEVHNISVEDAMGIFYNSPEFDYIDSMDTSNPVVHGIKKIRYDGPLGLTTKETQKLCELIDSNVNSTKWSYILYNLREFRYRWNGRYGVL